MRDLPRSVCFCKPCQPALDTKDFTTGMKASLWGERLICPAKYFWVLGRFCLETFLSSACLGWLCQTPCSYVGSLDVSTLHTFKTNRFLASSLTDPGHHNYIYDIIGDFFIRCTFQDPTGYPRILNIVDLRPL
jgi:hypothetical protein